MSPFNVVSVYTKSQSMSRTCLQSSFDCSIWEVRYVHCILLLDQANKKLFSIAHRASSNRFICASTSKSVSSVAGHCACAKLTNLRLQDMEQQKTLATASNQSVAVLTSNQKISGIWSMQRELQNHVLCLLRIACNFAVENKKNKANGNKMKWINQIKLMEKEK